MNIELGPNTYAVAGLPSGPGWNRPFYLTHHLTNVWLKMEHATSRVSCMDRIESARYWSVGQRLAIRSVD
jgi:hypothetical protein